jgi:hypothetical protein
MAASPLSPWNVLNRTFRTLGEDGVMILLVTTIVYVVPDVLVRDGLRAIQLGLNLEDYLSYWEALGLSLAAYALTFILHTLRLGIAGQALTDRWRDKRKRSVPFAALGIGLAKGLRSLWLCVPITALSYFLFFSTWGVLALPVQLLSFGMVTIYVLDGLSLKQAWRFGLSLLKGRLWLITGNIILMDILLWLLKTLQSWIELRISAEPSSTVFWEWAVMVPAATLVETFLFAWAMSLFFTAREQNMGKVEGIEAVFE